MLKKKKKKRHRMNNGSNIPGGLWELISTYILAIIKKQINKCYLIYYSILVSGDAEIASKIPTSTFQFDFQ